MSEANEDSVPAVKLSARDKAAVTDEAARTIIELEVTAREKKTARLRELRLQQQEAEVPAKPAKGKRASAAKPA